MFIIDEINSFLLGLTPFCAALVFLFAVIVCGILLHIFCNIIEACGLPKTGGLCRLILLVLFLVTAVFVFTKQLFFGRGWIFASTFLGIIISSLFIICFVSDIKEKFKSHRHD